MLSDLLILPKYIILTACFKHEHGNEKVKNENLKEITKNDQV